jgi:hypothetical protein
MSRDAPTRGATPESENVRSRGGRSGFASRLMVAQALVLAACALTTWVVASAVGPGLFREHLAQAGDTHTTAETAHIEEAFGAALLLSVTVALVAAVAAALAVSWYFTRRVSVPSRLSLWRQRASPQAGWTPGCPHPVWARSSTRSPRDTTHSPPSLRAWRSPGGGCWRTWRTRCGPRSQLSRHTWRRSRTASGNSTSRRWQ